ncbi:MAG: DUF1653 domain-containing protein [Candidatus Moranbacteria bacterium]|nr:DUF1653 domain-containing protein [Candidatus Moranbacteria bacterium]
MERKSGEALRRDLSEAHTRIRIDERYRHYKGREYTVVGCVVIEATDEMGVLYRADYAELEGIVFLRPLQEFLSSVETDEGQMPRFALIS